MKQQEWEISPKPYDLRARLQNFAVIIVRIVQFLHRQGPIAKALSYQILDSGMSAGANYEEADDGSSPRDKRAKRRIALRELKETYFRLQVLRRVGILTEIQEPVLDENSQLIKILATVIRNAGPD